MKKLSLTIITSILATSTFANSVFFTNDSNQRVCPTLKMGQFVGKTSEFLAKLKDVESFSTCVDAHQTAQLSVSENSKNDFYQIVLPWSQQDRQVIGMGFMKGEQITPMTVSFSNADNFEIKTKNNIANVQQQRTLN
jgi:hypothetical protein